ncbi:MBL fold metallo-hydrolase [Desulfosoma caldarium]|uniref:Ribonuclease BN (tRNA processing enzyme) n=1 Tax=Desulfosoma caldarium TaxID=610254 RepID=A0A3N1USC4_9BACT|nr:ribonuclease Z [Desulfosoma caldarium]ROQ92279.1 ribonuclease BN (tRNA processing enzyme) [Desulfosoma caldarium]
MKNSSTEVKVSVEFLGVGEACDETQPNTSLLLRARPAHNPTTSVQILLDCGFSVPHRYFHACSDPETLDAVWISHFHGDHFFGMPLLLLRFWEMKRLKPLTVVCQPGGLQRLLDAMDLAYPGFAKKLTFALHEVALDAGGTAHVHDITWRAAQTEHGQKNLSVRIDGGDWSLFYSGDGRPTAETQTLAQGCTLAVHEAFALNGDHLMPGHGTIQGCLDWARAAGVHRLALVHIQRDVRRAQWRDIVETVGQCHDLKAMVPASGDIVSL